MQPFRKSYRINDVPISWLYSQWTYRCTSSQKSSVFNHKYIPFRKRLMKKICTSLWVLPTSVYTIGCTAGSRWCRKRCLTNQTSFKSSVFRNNSVAFKSLTAIQKDLAFRNLTKGFKILNLRPMLHQHRCCKKLPNHYNMLWDTNYSTEYY